MSLITEQSPIHIGSKCDTFVNPDNHASPLIPDGEPV